MKQLTIKEAIKQGYKYYGLSRLEWQNVMELSDLNPNKDSQEKLVLFEKKSSQPTIDSQTIANVLADHIAGADSDDSNRDNDCVYKTVERMDFTKVANKINKELEKHKYWILTDIELVK